MLDIKLIKENPQDIKDRLLAKGSDCCAEIDRILELDEKRRDYIMSKTQAGQVIITSCYEEGDRFPVEANIIRPFTGDTITISNE